MVKAVAAACAIPMLCPPVGLADSRFLDAGLRSNENLDLAKDFGSVLVISPRGLLAPQAFGGNMLTQEVEILRNAGARVEVIEPQGQMLDLICEHMLDALASMEIAEAGREQGRQEAARCASILADARR
jgi:NTE family protein